MTPIMFERMVFYKLEKPMMAHTIELIEPIYRHVNIAICYPMWMYMKDSGQEPFDVYVTTIGLDGVQ